MSGFLLTSILAILLHAVGIAEYHLKKNENLILMKVVIDKHELDTFSFPADCDFDKTTALCLANYVSANSTIIINGKPVEFYLEGSSTENHHFILKLSAPLLPGEISSLEIWNNCFTEFDSDFKNRIVLDIDKFQSSYLLSKADSRLFVE
jgi:hypothetical protein